MTPASTMKALPFALVALALSSPVAAQRASALRVGVGLESARGSDAASSHPATSPTDGADMKSPVAGVLLSGLVFPGLGSFYAGNDRHGWIHAGISAAAIVGTLAASGSCRRSCPNENGGVVLGLSTLIVNDIWSMFTAARDVGEANAPRAKSP
jgi:TM2 domain-containing membrane protein YozV